MWRIINRHKNQRGQALLLTLVVLALSSVILIPLVNTVSTGIKNTQTFQKNTKGIYAADAGIHFGMWQIENNSQIASNRNNTNYDTTISYTLTGVNNNNVNVQVTNNWLFYYLFRLPWGETPHDPYLETSCTYSNGVFNISFTNTSNNPMIITKMGVWLPAGFSYTGDSCNQTNFPTNIDFSEPVVTPIYGGVNLVWNSVSGSLPQNSTVNEQFKYSPAGGALNAAASWVFPQQQSVGASWDNTGFWYDIISTATDNTTGRVTTVDATVVYDPTSSDPPSLVAYIFN